MPLHPAYYFLIFLQHLHNSFFHLQILKAFQLWFLSQLVLRFIAPCFTQGLRPLNYTLYNYGIYRTKGSHLRRLLKLSNLLFDCCVKLEALNPVPLRNWRMAVHNECMASHSTSRLLQTRLSRKVAETAVNIQAKAETLSSVLHPCFVFLDGYMLEFDLRTMITSTASTRAFQRCQSFWKWPSVAKTMNYCFRCLEAGIRPRDHHNQNRRVQKCIVVVQKM